MILALVGLTMYPWLRGHGSIEAKVKVAGSIPAVGVSMAERSWLH